MDKLDKEIIKLVTKYPFLTDPIVLFNPSKIPSKENILKWTLNLQYPEIDKSQIDLNKIKNNYYKVIDILNETIFETIYSKIEYSHRLKDFYKVIRIIEIFYDKNEYEKYNLVNEYFWIDFELLEEIFSNKELFINEFNYKKPLLSERKILKLENKEINSSEIKFYFIESLKFLWLEKNWKVVIWDAVSIVHSNFNEKWGDIIIPREKTVNIKVLLWLIAHEIDWHCIQFTNCNYLSSWTIRYSRSESLAEWFAMYNQYFFLKRIFWEKIWLSHFYNKSSHKFDFIENKISFESFIKSYKWNIIRNFRWFSNIYKYRNLKDFVYIQGLYRTIKYRKKYNNFFEMMKSWAVNDSYIKKYWDERWRKEKLKISEMSAYFVLKKYF